MLVMWWRYAGDVVEICYVCFVLPCLLTILQVKHASGHRLGMCSLYLARPA